MFEEDDILMFDSYFLKLYQLKVESRLTKVSTWKWEMKNLEIIPFFRAGEEEAQDTVRKLQIKNQRLELKVASNLRGGWA